MRVFELLSEEILSTKRPMAFSATYPMEGHDVGRIRNTPGRGPRALYAMPTLRRDVKLGGRLPSCRSQAATEHSLFRERELGGLRVVPLRPR
jgi:hypothetical protein